MSFVKMQSLFRILRDELACMAYEIWYWNRYMQHLQDNLLSTCKNMDMMLTLAVIYACNSISISRMQSVPIYHHWRCMFEPRSWRGVLDTTLCDQVCQWLPTDRWFSPGTPVSTTNKTDLRDITEILLKVALNTINVYKPTQTILRKA